jgi:hypothetical protein
MYVSFARHGVDVDDWPCPASDVEVPARLGTGNTHSNQHQMTVDRNIAPVT